MFDDLEDEPLFSKEEEDEEEEELPPEKALAFLKRFYTRPSGNNRKNEQLRMLALFLGEQLPDLMGMIPLDTRELIQLFQYTPAMTAAALEQVRLPELREKTVIGVGGAFSAGKSRFLNALTGFGHLPENQGPTTAVGTYIVRGYCTSVHAFTRYGCVVPINLDELPIITHDFYNKYKIGFADILHKIIITTHSMSLPENIVLLDTPGYNKADQGDQEQEAQDSRIAREHLLNCDYLIWLLSADNGTLTASDIKFLKSLDLHNECLVVITKADMKDNKGTLESIVRNVEENVASEGIPCFGVTAYSSFLNKEYVGENLIKKFLKKVTDAKPHQDCFADLKTIKEEWKKAFKREKKKFDPLLVDLEDAISTSAGAHNILGLIYLYRNLKKQSNNICHNQKFFDASIKKKSSTPILNFASEIINVHVPKGYSEIPG